MGEVLLADRGRVGGAARVSSEAARAMAGMALLSSRVSVPLLLLPGCAVGVVSPSTRAAVTVRAASAVTAVAQD